VKRIDERTLTCESCNCRVFDRDPERSELELHEQECSGHDTARERFDRGDRVEYSKFGLSRLDYDQRVGEVVGFARKNERCVRVLWEDRSTPQNLSHRFIVPEGFHDES
jgi:hypothetical protein